MNETATLTISVVLQVRLFLFKQKIKIQWMAKMSKYIVRNTIYTLRKFLSKVKVGALLNWLGSNRPQLMKLHFRIASEAPRIFFLSLYNVFF